MKRIFLFGILILANGFAMGQVKSKSTAAKPTTTNAKSATKANNNASLNAANSVSLNSIVAYPAKQIEASYLLHKQHLQLAILSSLLSISEPREPISNSIIQV